MSTGSTMPFAASGTVTLAASTTSASGALSQGDTVLVFNSTASVAFVSFGNNAATATITSTPVPPGGTRLLYIGPIANFAAAILSAGTGSVFITTGTGTAY